MPGGRPREGERLEGGRVGMYRMYVSKDTHPGRNVMAGMIGKKGDRVICFDWLHAIDFSGTRRRRQMKKNTGHPRLPPPQTARGKKCTWEIGARGKGKRETPFSACSLPSGRGPFTVHSQGEA